jgi:hypothetical protein
VITSGVINRRVRPVRRFAGWAFAAPFCNPSVKAGKIINDNVAQAFQPVIFLGAETADWEVRPTTLKGYAVLLILLTRHTLNAINQHLKGQFQRDEVRLLHKLITGFLICLIGLQCAAFGQDNAVNSETASKEKYEKYFQISIPKDFNAETGDEAGIYKWKKDSAEIFIVMGNTFSESTDVLLDALKKSLAANKDISETEDLKLENGRGFLYKGKPLEDETARQMWRMVVFTPKKMIHVDFIAPAKEFDSLAPVFQEIIKSFKLRPAA